MRPAGNFETAQGCMHSQEAEMPDQLAPMSISPGVNQKIGTCIPNSTEYN